MRILLGFIVFLVPSIVQAHVSHSPPYTYQQMKTDLQKLSQEYPELIHLTVIGHTPYHRNIYAVSLGHGDSSVVINASHHAREWITTCVVMDMIKSYCQGYETNRSIQGYPVRTTLDNERIWFIPMVNPDGVTLQQFGPNVFPLASRRQLIHWNHGRSDFSQWKANAQGIDLNLQYSADWDKIKTVNSPAPKQYKGKKPFQAKEVVAVKQFLEQTQPTYVVSYHASGNVIFSNPLPDDRHPIAKDLSERTNYRVVSIADSFGGLTDWWDKHKNKVGITIEVGPYCGEDEVPRKYIASISQANRAVGLYLAARRLHVKELDGVSYTHAIPSKWLS